MVCRWYTCRPSPGGIGQKVERYCPVAPAEEGVFLVLTLLFIGAARVSQGNDDQGRKEESDRQSHHGDDGHTRDLSGFASTWA